MNPRILGVLDCLSRGGELVACFLTIVKQVPLGVPAMPSKLLCNPQPFGLAFVALGGVPAL